ncbi:TIGR03758 family integrating conjugative element protein [Yersinia similis]|uniref:TIGR03758 family integrating conjugative element protein n=1 Tax=Yersinia similis TaxID=367190 RepID=UPI00061BC7D7|nr:TIGR03758 family integrating conjugative element protein [Yersinia similis]CNC01899.1 integrating conjugative element protein%2C PFL_4701 family [Yersinia similis]
MNDAQTRAFKAAASNIEPSVLNSLFIGSLVAVLMLWAGWGLVHVYRGYALRQIKEQTVMRFVLRTLLLLLITTYLFAN